jgi:hypothetical protein
MWNPFDISLDTANRFYAFGWRASVIGAAITMVGILFLFWGTRVRDRDFDSQMSNLNSRAAALNADAAKARLETAQLWKEASARRIDQDALTRALSERAKEHVEIFFAKNDADSAELANSIFLVFLRLDWPMNGLPQPIPESREYPIPDALMLGAQSSGVSVVARAIPPDDDGSTFSVLSKALLPALGSVSGGRDEKMPAGAIRIVIAPKPPLRIILPKSAPK